MPAAVVGDGRGRRRGRQTGNGGGGGRGSSPPLRRHDPDILRSPPRQGHVRSFRFPPAPATMTMPTQTGRHTYGVNEVSRPQPKRSTRVHGPTEAQDRSPCCRAVHDRHAHDTTNTSSHCLAAHRRNNTASVEHAFWVARGYLVPSVCALSLIYEARSSNTGSDSYSYMIQICHLCTVQLVVLGFVGILSTLANCCFLYFLKGS